MADQFKTNHIVVASGLVFIAAIFIFIPALAAQAQSDGSVPPSDSSASAPPVPSTPPPAVVPANPSSSSAVTPKKAPAGSASSVEPQTQPVSTPPVTVEPTNPTPAVSVAEPAQQPIPATKPSPGIIALIAAGGIAVLGAAGAFVLRARKNSGNGNEDDPCGRIKQQLEQKKAELDQTTSTLSLKQELADQLKQTIDDKQGDAADKLREKTVSRLLGKEKGGTVNKVADFASTSKDAYESIQDRWEQAKQVVESLKRKRQQQAKELQALESSYNACVLTAASRDLAPYISALTNSPGAQTIFLFGGAEVDLNQAVPEIKMIGEVLKQIGAKQVLHIPFARIKTSEADWTGDWFNRNIQLPGLEYLNAANEGDIAKAGSPVIFISGGHEHDNLMEKLRSNPRLLELINTAQYIIGESAGSKALGEYQRSGHLGDKNTKLVKGLGIVKNTVISPHYTEHNREPELLHDMEQSGMKQGIGIDSLTAIMFNVDEFPGKYKKIGPGAVQIKKL